MCSKKFFIIFLSSIMFCSYSLHAQRLKKKDISALQDNYLSIYLKNNDIIQNSTKNKDINNSVIDQLNNLQFYCSGSYSNEYWNINIFTGKTTIQERVKKGDDFIVRANTNRPRDFKFWLKYSCLDKDELYALTRDIDNRYMKNVYEFISTGDEYAKTNYYINILESRFDNSTSRNSLGRYLNHTSLNLYQIASYDRINDFYSSMSSSLSGDIPALGDFIRQYKIIDITDINRLYNRFLTESNQLSFKNFEYYINGLLPNSGKLYSCDSCITELYRLDNNNRIIKYLGNLYEVRDSVVITKYDSPIHKRITNTLISTYIDNYSSQVINKYLDHLESKYLTDWNEIRTNGNDIGQLYRTCVALLRGTMGPLTLHEHCQESAHKSANARRVSLTKYLVPEKNWYKINYYWNDEKIYLDRWGYLKDHIIYDENSKSLKVSSVDNSPITLESSFIESLNLRGVDDIILYNNSRYRTIRELHDSGDKLLLSGFSLYW